MIKNKIMNLLRKGNDTMKLRKMAMVFALASMVLVGGVGCGVSDKDTAKTEKVETVEIAENNKEESSVKETTEVTETKEDINKEQTSNTDKKKEENIKNEKPKKDNSSSNTTVSNVNKPSKPSSNTENSKPSKGNGSSSKPSKPNSGASSKPSTSSKPAHTHNHTHTWEEVTTTVHHKEQGHYENVVVKEAWTEKKPKYETKERSICNGCGKDITGNPWDHIEEQMLAGNTACGGYHSEWREVQVGTETINHPAVIERKWVVDKPAWVETVVTGRKCSVCGATK